MKVDYDLLTEVQSSSGPSRSPVYVSTQFKDVQPPKTDALTLYHSFVTACQKFPDEDCLGERCLNPDGTIGDFKFWTFRETADRVIKLASGMKALKISKGSTIGIYGANCREWMIAMQACNRLGLVCVPLYDTLANDAVEYIVNHSELRTIFSDGSKLSKLETASKKFKRCVRHVIYWGEGGEEDVKRLRDGKIGVFDFDVLMEMGSGKEAPPDPPDPEDLCTIMYTSGSTGVPKGVMLTHKAMALNCDALRNYIGTVGIWGPGDRFLSYLPLAHSFDRTFEELMLASGIAIGYWQGDVTALFDDLAALKPTIMIGVPRVFDRLYASVMASVERSSWLRRFLFLWGYHSKLRSLKNGRPHAKAAPFFDRWIFDEVGKKLGGKIRWLLTGGAPIAAHTEAFLKVCSCAGVSQGYGLTETCAAIFISLVDDPDMDTTTGIPLAYVQFCLESVPEMQYDATGEQPIGEVCVRAPYNFVGYYKAEDLTEEVLDADGWFHTGDIGTITPEGALKLVDRKKNILKLSQGEYVAVEKVEGIYKQSTAVEQIWVHGNSMEDYLVAVVVPSEAYVETWASDRNKPYNYSHLCKDKELIEDVQSIMDRHAEDQELKGFERVKKIYLESEQFSPVNALLTPTFKMKRPELKKKYQSVLSKLYDSKNVFL